MRLKSLPILLLCLHFCLISTLYFFALCLHIDGRWVLPADLALLLASLGLVYRSGYFKPSPERTTPLWDYAELALWLVLSLLLWNKAQPFALVHGQWDAWAMWNTHARFLTSSDTWTLMLDPAMFWNSPDYPLNLPAFIAAIWVHTAHFDATVPYLAALFATIAIPAIIYFELSGRSRLMALLAFIVFIQHRAFLQCGMAQYADVLLGLFYLCSLVCIEQLQQQAGPVKITAFLSGFFLATVLWTKNEGWLFVIPVLLVFAPTLLQRKNRLVFAGMAIPLAALLVFKLFFAPRNFGATHFTLANFLNFFDGARYRIIFDFSNRLAREQFALLPYALVVQVALMLLLRRLDRSMLVVFLAFLLYMSLFVFFDFSLEWQLATSLDRLWMQLEIPFVYIFFKTAATGLQKIPAWHNNKWLGKSGW